MTYPEVLEYMFSSFPMFHRIGTSAYKNNLDNSLLLDKETGFSHKKFRSIHIAGTNGKGSVSHFLASILQSAGYKTGLFTSPHLKDFRERIKINGICISEKDVVEFIEKYNIFFQKIQPSFFEMTTAMAFDFFAKQKVDVAIIEVGLGGRLDSTNIISPILSIITNISYDHTDLLGETLEKIAAEKAGIIKKNIPVIIGETHHSTRGVFLQKSQECDSQIFLADHHFSAQYSFHTTDHKQLFNVYKNGKLFFDNLKTDLLGNYQSKNIPTVCQAIEVLVNQGIAIKREQIYEGFLNAASKTGLKGRWQILGEKPLIICDTGHNEAGISNVVEQINCTPHKHLHFILGLVKEKNLNKILPLLPTKNVTYYFTKPNIPRSVDEKVLCNEAFSHGLVGKTFATVSQAYEEAKRSANENDFIFIGGSTFVVAEII